MKSEKIGRHILLAFGLAAILYLVAYSSIEHLRTRKGGWQVTFRTDSTGVPSIELNQPKLAIAQVRFLFPEEHLAKTNLHEIVLFDRPKTNVPFGKVIYFDTTFLPGSIVLGLFGHEIQFLPRVLLLDRREVAWRSGATFVLNARGKPASRPGHP
jgi:hypothetical protein